ncbi:MAG: hypothetical protein V9G14_01300 [Cypionkella sp.]
MADISIETVAGKLNRVGYDAFVQSLRHAKNEGNRNVELSHWLFHIAANPKSDLSMTLQHFKLDRARLVSDLGSVIDALRKNATEMPAVADQVIALLDRGWHYATLLFAESQIRTGHILVAALKDQALRRELIQMSKTVRRDQCGLAGFRGAVGLEGQ